MNIGDLVTVKPGTTAWLKENGHWADFITSEIDGMNGIIERDYRHLQSKDARLCVQLGFLHHVGIPEHLLELCANDNKA